MSEAIQSTHPRITTNPPAVDVPPGVAAPLERLGRALGAGDLPGVAACFAYPSLLLTGADTHEFRDPQQVQVAFRRWLDWHKDAGIVETHPEFEQSTHLGHGIHDCTVRWPAVDAHGKLVANEQAHYIIQETTTGTGLIRVGVAVVSSAADEPLPRPRSRRPQRARQAR